MNNDLVYLKCVKEGSKLRVKVISPGYNTEANCQFPRDIRQDGRVYSVHRKDISFAKGPAGKFFYRVKKNIEIVTSEEVTLGDRKVTLDKIFEADEQDCLICFDKPHDVVFVPCGHYIACGECSSKLQKRVCPMCRANIELIVTRDQIQIG